MRVLTDQDISDTLTKAKQSPRKRAHLLLHKHSDPVQRMLNAIFPGSYIPPHRHKNPDKIETFIILKGKVACLKFTSSGKIQLVYVLDEDGPIKVVDIRPGIYHSFLALEPSVMLEIIQGPYSPDTHKDWPSWAPQEDDPKATEYYQQLKQQVLSNLTESLGS